MDPKMPNTLASTTEQPKPDPARKVRSLTLLLNTLPHDTPSEEVLSFVKDAVELVKEAGSGLAQMLLENADFKGTLSGLSARNNGKTETLVLDWLKQQIPPPPTEKL